MSPGQSGFEDGVGEKSMDDFRRGWRGSKGTLKDRSKGTSGEVHGPGKGGKGTTEQGHQEPERKTAASR